MQPVTTNAPLKTTIYASVVRRLVAYAVDVMLLYTAVLTAQFVLFTLTQGRISTMLSELDNWVLLWGWAWFTISLPIWSYFALSEASTKQATLGKRLLGLRVTNTAGNRLRARHAWLRTIAKLGYLEIGHVAMFQFFSRPIAAQVPAQFPTSIIVVLYGLMGLYVAVMVLTPRRQSVHDLLVGTVVVQHGNSQAD